MSISRPARVVHVSALGLRLALDDVALRGERLRVLLPLNGAMPEPVDIGVAVIRCRDNPAAYLGRFTCGTAYEPAAQPGARRIPLHHRGGAAA